MSEYKKNIVKKSRMALMGGSLLALGACGTALDRQYINLSGGGATPNQAQAVTVPGFNGIEANVENRSVIVVRQGETLPSVSNRAGVSVTALAAANSLSTSSPLAPGQILQLPRAETQNDASNDNGELNLGPNASQDNIQTASLGNAQNSTNSGTHTVAAGDTAFSISRLYGISVSDLAQANGLGSNFALRQGQVLTIPSGAAPQNSATTANTSSPAPAPSSSSGGFTRPVSGGITSNYSSDSDGIIFAANSGESVRAATSGQVALVSQSTGDQGTIILVRDSNGLITVYGRMGNVNVSRGDSVQKGQVLGTTAGNSLLFQVREGTESRNPNNYF